MENEENNISNNDGVVNESKENTIVKRTYNYNKYSDEEILNYLKELAIKLGRTPLIKDIKDDSKLYPRLFYKHFGSFIKAQKLAGLIPTRRVIVNSNDKKYTNEELLNYLKEVAIKLGRTPSIKDIEEDGKIYANIFYKRFGTFSNAQKEAGLIPTKRAFGNNNRPKYTKEDLINHLKELAIKLGRTPSVKDIKDDGKIYSNSYYRRFVSLTNAQKEAGLIPTIRGNVNVKPKYSDENLLIYLKELAIKLGRTPALKDIKDDGKLNSNLYYRRFGTLTNAQKEAGLASNKRGRKNKPQTENNELDDLKIS